MPNGWAQTLLLFAASAAAGAINSVAGGGTLLTFPALLAAGYLSTVANATSTVALWPGQISSLWGLRREAKEGVQGSKVSVWILLVVGIVGGALGAYLLTCTHPELFSRIVPYLILLSVAVFLAQEPLSRYLKTRAAQDINDVETPDTLRLTFPVTIFLFVVAVYGGYFGAGIGILTLAALGLIGMRDIHRMNGIKAFFTLGINVMASILFIQRGIVEWHTVGLMAAGSLFGGYAGAGIARRLGQQNVRRVVVIIGIVLALQLLVRTGR